jgi:hypothetical protein
MTKYAVVYLEPKKKGFSRQEAVFYDLEDAAAWEKHVKTLFNTKTEIVPLFN